MIKDCKEIGCIRLQGVSSQRATAWKDTQKSKLTIEKNDR